MTGQVPLVVSLYVTVRLPVHLSFAVAFPVLSTPEAAIQGTVTLAGTMMLAGVLSKKMYCVDEFEFPQLSTIVQVRTIAELSGSM
jgi:hypothetical protein